MLSADQVATYRRDGYVVADGAVSAQSLARLRDALDGWTEEAARRGANFGEIADGRARRMARLEGGAVELPPPYRNASFFEVQTRSEDKA